MLNNFPFHLTILLYLAAGPAQVPGGADLFRGGVRFPTGGDSYTWDSP